MNTDYLPRLEKRFPQMIEPAARAFARSWGLEVRFSWEESWWFPDRTLLVEYARGVE
jgi:hypothetical protein